MTHFHGSRIVQDLLSRDVNTSVGIFGSVGRASGSSPSVHALFRRLTDFWDGMVRCAANRAFVSNIAAALCVVSTGQDASVLVRSARDCWSCTIGDVEGGSRSRGSVMSNANNAPAGSEATSVTEASDNHTDCRETAFVSEGGVGRSKIGRAHV